MPFPTLPDPVADRDREAARWHPERETLELAKASITMATVDLWRARLKVKTLRRDQREAIAEAAEV